MRLGSNSLGASSTVKEKQDTADGRNSPLTMNSTAVGIFSKKKEKEINLVDFIGNIRLLYLYSQTLLEGWLTVL